MRVFKINGVNLVVAETITDAVQFYQEEQLRRGKRAIGNYEERPPTDRDDRFLESIRHIASIKDLGPVYEKEGEQ